MRVSSCSLCSGLAPPASSPMTFEAFIFNCSAFAQPVPSAWSPPHSSNLKCHLLQEGLMTTVFEMRPVLTHFLYSTYCVFFFLIMFVSLVGYLFGYLSFSPRSVLLKLEVVKGHVFISNMSQANTSMHACSVARWCLTLCDSMDCGPPGSLPMGFSRQEHWSGLPCPPPGDLLDPGIEPASVSCVGRQVLYH